MFWERHFFGIQEEKIHYIQCNSAWDSGELNGKEVYSMKPRDLEFLNLKPDVLKMENVGKNPKSLAISYQIEKIQIPDDSEAVEYHLEFDSFTGSVDHGSKKLMSIRLTNVASNTDSTNKKAKKQTDASVYSQEKVAIVNYFRITMKGGYKCTEPKGVAEQTDWLLKVMLE